MKRFFCIFALGSCLLLSSCGWMLMEVMDHEVHSIPEGKSQAYYVNLFGAGVMSVYYLWCDEIKDGLESWSAFGDPAETVEAIRYKDSEGNDIDRWTQMFDNYTEMTASVAGTSTTYGFEFSLYYADRAMKSVVAVVTYVVNDGPAARCGMKRGDIITRFNGKELTPDNYVDTLNEEFYGAAVCSFTLSDGSEKTMSAVNMYEDPVLLYKTFDRPGGKIGYLVYNSFTLKSYDRLMEAFTFFKEEGVKDLILDLRYNGGGYVETEMALASMIAPESEVKAGSLFETTIYNAALTEALEDEGDHFRTDFSFEEDGETVTYSTEGCNPGIQNVYAILGSGSASASESLLVGLMPLMRVRIIGQQSHGKYCSGIMLRAADWYDSMKDVLNPNTCAAGMFNSGDWGIYVMIGRYADRNGDTPCMPDGFTPDVPVDDDPRDGFALGDPRETMLAVALSQAGYAATQPSSVAKDKKESRSSGLGIPVGFDSRLAPASFGKLIRTGREVKVCPVLNSQYTDLSF